jgi:large subunit ribosomal protein L20
MVRVTNAVAANRRRKRILRRAKGFWGDRKNHLRISKEAVMRAMAYNYAHRKVKKREFRRIWITRISAAAKINGISYSKFMNGLKKAQCDIDRKMLADMAIRDPSGFAVMAQQAKKALA